MIPWCNSQPEWNRECALHLFSPLQSLLPATIFPSLPSLLFTQPGFDYLNMDLIDRSWVIPKHSLINIHFVTLSKSYTFKQMQDTPCLCYLFSTHFSYLISQFRRKECSEVKWFWVFNATHRSLCLVLILPKGFTCLCSYQSFQEVRG